MVQYNAQGLGRKVRRKGFEPVIATIPACFQCTKRIDEAWGRFTQLDPVEAHGTVWRVEKTGLNGTISAHRDTNHGDEHFSVVFGFSPEHTEERCHECLAAGLSVLQLRHHAQQLLAMERALHDLKERFTDTHHEQDVFRPFQQSNFKVVYDKSKGYPTGSRELRQSLVLQSLDELGVYHKQARTDSISDPDCQALFLWTKDAVYKRLNRALLQDDPDEIAKFGYLIRAINNYIVNHPAPEEKTVFRGTRIDVHKQGVQVDPSQGSAGDTFRQPCYVAASASLLMAQSFGQAGSPLLEYKVPKGCLNCTPIPSEFSDYPDEEEWLMPPYTAVQYVDQRVEDLDVLGPTLIITYNVLDNQHASSLEHSGVEIQTCLAMLFKPPEPMLSGSLALSSSTPPAATAPLSGAVWCGVVRWCAWRCGIRRDGGCVQCEFVLRYYLC